MITKILQLWSFSPEHLVVVCGAQGTNYQGQLEAFHQRIVMLLMVAVYKAIDPPTLEMNFEQKSLKVQSTSNH